MKMIYYHGKKDETNTPKVDGASPLEALIPVLWNSRNSTALVTAFSIQCIGHFLSFQIKTMCV